MHGRIYRAARPGDSPRPHISVFQGIDPATGKPHDFASGQIVRYPILDADKKPAGVYYPSEPGDVEVPIVWTREGLEQTRAFFYVVEKNESIGQPAIGMKRARWAGMTPEEGLVFRGAHTHSNGSGYLLKIVPKVPGTGTNEPVVVAVDGATFGLINVADDLYRQAVARFAKVTDIDLGCAAAAGPAGGDAAAAMRSSGFGSRFFASEEDVLRMAPHDAQGRGVLAAIGVETDFDRVRGTARDPWVELLGARTFEASD